jgi:hypothetical protein
MVVDDGLLLVMLRDPTIIVLQPKDVIFPPPGIHPKMEESSVCIPFFENGNP